MSSDQLTLIRFHDDRTVLADIGSAPVVLKVAAVQIATRLFRHDPPTPGEIEQAIDWVEDALATIRLEQSVCGELVIDSRTLFEQLQLHAVGERMTRDQLEARFQRLASISLGHPRARDDPPTEPMAAALLLILRECMHHLGYVGLVVERR